MKTNGFRCFPHLPVQNSNYITGSTVLCTVLYAKNIKDHPVCIIYYTVLCTVVFVQTVQYQLIKFTVCYRVLTLDDDQRNFLYV
jgi:hypothetical protein